MFQELEPEPDIFHADGVERDTILVKKDTGHNLCPIPSYMVFINAGPCVSRYPQIKSLALVFTNIAVYNGNVCNYRDF